MSLDGDDWQLRGCLGDEWQWHLEKPWDAPGWLPARVPGSVIDDLWRAGEIADPYHGRNSLQLEWIPERSWIYRRRVPGGRIRFEGVDHEATVFVDGRQVAHHVGAFTSFEADVPPGDHLLAVVVHPAPESEPQVGRTSRVRVHKPRMNYGWDFCPRMVHQGIWRSVVQDAPQPVAPVVRLVEGVGTVEVDGEVVFRVESPRLWWPDGLGEQWLYDVPELGIAVGFRTVELVPNEGAPNDALPYTFVVNGHRIYVRGWNWVPVDPLYGVPRPGKLEHLLRRAQWASVNLLRVWGGGLIETPEFYEHCDRLGILVWQEFSQSSSGMESTPSDDPEFVATLAADARHIVLSRRRHPSLAAWCGGNELAFPDKQPVDESSPVIRALGDVVRELDPDRAWLPTSPTGPDGKYDMHGPWEHQGLRAHYAHYDARTNLIHSEFGVEGMTNRRSLEALIPEAERWPADRTNPMYEHLGAWWNNAPLVQDAFGGRIADVETMRRASQWLQYEGLRYAVEANKRRAWRSSGVIPWQLNESYPNAWSTSAIDHHGDAKPAYYGVARAYRGAPSAQFETCAWGGESEFRASSEQPMRVVTSDGTVVVESEGGELICPLEHITSDVFLLDVAGNPPRPETGLDRRRWRYRWRYGNRYVMTRTENLAPLLDLPPAQISAHFVGDSRRFLELRNEGSVLACGIVVEDARPYDAEGWVAFYDNVIDLLPGERYEIPVEIDGPFEELRIEGWNARV